MGSAATPLFMLIASVLLFRKEFTWLANIKKKLKTIGLPFLFWNLFWMAVFFVGQSLPMLSVYFPNPERMIAKFNVMDWVYAFTGKITENGADRYPFYYPFWFLKDLFIFNCFALIIKKAVDKIPLAFFVSSLTCWVSSIRFYIVGSEAFFFFVAGYYIVKYDLHIHMLKKLRFVKVSLFYALSITAELLFSDQIVAMRKLNILIGILFLIKLTDVVFEYARPKRFFIFLSTYVFMIYGCHEFTLSFIKKLTFRLLPQTMPTQLIQYFLIPAFVIALCVMAGCCLRKISPKFYGLITGGR